MPCQKKGHIPSACHLKPKAGNKQSAGTKRQHLPKGVHNLDVNLDGDELGLYTIYTTNVDKPTANQGRDFWTEIFVNEQLFTMRIDMAADCSVMSEDLYENKFSHVPLHESKVKLKSYSGKALETRGQMNCQV